MAMQAGFWAMFAAIVAYQTALLLERGFSNSEAGLMTAVRCLAGIVFQPLLGGFADRHPRLPLKHIVTISMALSLVAGVWYWISPGMGLWETTLVWVVIGGLEVSSYPLMDAMAVQFINEGVPIRYSLGRGIGSLAYAVVCVVLGFQAGRLGLESTLVTHLVLVTDPSRRGVQVAATIRRVAELAERRGVTMTEISLAWLLTKVTAPVVGATKRHHVEGAASAVDLALTEEEIAWLEEVYVPHRLVGVMAQNTRAAAGDKHVWSTGNQEIEA